MKKIFYVYFLIDPVTGQPFYVGKGSKRRMYEHYRLRNRLTNKLLKNKLCKLYQLGYKVLYQKVLENVTEQEAFEKEKQLIQKYGKLIDKTGILCNLTNGGEGNSCSWSQEKRKKTSERMKGKRGHLPLIQKPVVQYTLHGEYIRTFPSALQASKEVPKANHSYIIQVCKGKRNSAGGFLWSYEGNIPLKFIKKYYQRVQQFTLKGELIATYDSLTQAQKLTGIKVHNISQCCRGKSKTAGGFIWKYLK